ncbi:MAG: hypothetical protein ACN6O3_10575 [Comamonas sp.]
MSEFKSLIHRVRDAKAPSPSSRMKKPAIPIHDEDQADGGLSEKEKRQTQQEGNEAPQQLDQAKATHLQQQA